MALRYTSLVLVCICLSTFGQTVLTPEDYNDLKGHDQLPSGTILISGPSGTGLPVSSQATQRGGGGCECWVEPDNNYSLAMTPNDDMSSSAIALPFTFELFGDQYDTLWINNNGNLSFVNPYGSFSSLPFPAAEYKMVAAFWADVDTRGDDGNGLNGGLVVYRLTPTALYVNWIDVGYFASQTDKHNSFQLIITDGTDPAVPGGNNVSYCYRDMQWTTGSASMGQGGFGGVPATVGVNRGDGVDHSQIGRFGYDDETYGGPYADTSGISWLDSTHFYMNTAGGNMPPIFGSNLNCDTVIVQIMAEGSHGPLDQKVWVLPGAPGQQVSCTVDAPSLPGFNGWSAGPADHLQILLDDYLTGALAGIHIVTFMATTGGIEPLTSQYTVQLELLQDQTGLETITSNSVLHLLPNPAQDQVRLSWNDQNRPVLIELIAVDGRSIRTVPVLARSRDMLLNISDLPPGSYRILARFSNGSAVQQLVKTDR
ncbi:MAG: hypothetical protein IPO90_08775 [Flavobacteriales bacterium]|nr:hypothetical protein [Flavobacteriales bacterium]